MRYIPKPLDSPAVDCIRGFIEAQMAERATGTSWEVLRVDYGSFARGPELRDLLIDEQKGLCAYTGVGLDGRLAAHLPCNMIPPRIDYGFNRHTEHLKSQRTCREELIARGGIVGRDVGEDLDYRNVVAALGVAGTQSEIFGAVAREDEALPILPTNPACATAFLYLEGGDIEPTSGDAVTTIEKLKLDHPTLQSWRRGAIRALLPLGPQTPRVELEALVEVLEDDSRETLPEFSFVIAQIARYYLALPRPAA